MDSQRVSPTEGQANDPYRPPDARVDDAAPQAVTGPAPPWPRYWARMLDVTLASVLVAVALYTSLELAAEGSRSAAALLESISELDASAPLIMQCLVYLPAALLLEAWVISLFGTTPGKWLAGLRVVGTEAVVPGFMTHLRRVFGVWWRGLGTGFPLVSLFTLLYCHSKARNGDVMHWDRVNGTLCIGEASSGARTTLTALLYIGFLFGITSLEAVAEG